MYIAFDGADSLNFGNKYIGKGVIFDVYNSSSSHTDNRKNTFLLLDEGPTSAINGSFGSLDKKLSINFSKANTKVCLSLYYNGGNSYLFVHGEEIYKFKAANENVNSPAQVSLGSTSNGSGVTESGEESLRENFQSITIQLIDLMLNLMLNIRKYLLVTNNIK